MINRVVLVGRLTRDPEIRYTASGVAVAGFGVAVDDPFRKDEAGEKVANFFDVTCWQKTAEYAANYLTKGRLVGIDGRLQYRSWVDNNGNKRSKVEVVAERVQGLDKRPENGEGAQSGSAWKPGGPEDPAAEPFYDPFMDE